MRLFLFASALVAAAAAFAQNAELAQVQRVYLLPMTGSLHLHLAHQCARLGLFQVVTDPLRADAVFTDRLGDAFEQRLADWDGEQAKRDAPEKGAEVKKPEAEADPRERQQLELAQRPLTSSFGGGKGNLFLVDRKSRRILWSTYEGMKGRTPERLERSAEHIAERLRQDWTGKKK
jgi:hypothetical protein